MRGCTEVGMGVLYVYGGRWLYDMWVWCCSPSPFHFPSGWQQHQQRHALLSVLNSSLEI